MYTEIQTRTSGNCNINTSISNIFSTESPNAVLYQELMLDMFTAIQYLSEKCTKLATQGSRTTLYMLKSVYSPKLSKALLLSLW